LIRHIQCVGSGNFFTCRRSDIFIWHKGQTVEAAVFSRNRSQRSAACRAWSFEDDKNESLITFAFLLRSHIPQQASERRRAGGCVSRRLAHQARIIDLRSLSQLSVAPSISRHTYGMRRRGESPIW
jgi:hypothetical protein